MTVDLGENLANLLMLAQYWQNCFGGDEQARRRDQLSREGGTFISNSAGVKGGGRSGGGGNDGGDGGFRGGGFRGEMSAPALTQQEMMSRTKVGCILMLA